MDGGDFSALEQLVTLAAQFQQEGKQDETAAVCDRIVRSTPQPTTTVERLARAQAFNFLAGCAAQREQVGTALDFFHQAINLSSEWPQKATEFRLNQTQLLIQIGWRERARWGADCAVRIAPPEMRAFALRVRARVARNDTDSKTALKLYGEALELEPDNIGLKLEYAAMLADSAKIEEAQAVYEAVWGGDSEYRAEGIHGRGLMRLRRMELAEAIEDFDEALKLDPSMNMARWNRAIAYLSLGNLADGFREHEARFGIGSNFPGVDTPAKRFNRPAWNGFSAADGGAKRLHFHGEMGLGDVLQFSRYALIARDMGHDVRVEVPRELVELLSYSLPGIAVVPQAADWPHAWGIEEFDVHLPLMSAPAVCGTCLDTVPYGDGYLSAHPEWVEKWRKLLAHLPRPLIGLCWRGQSRDGLWVAELDRRRSLSFDLAGQLMERSGQQFVCLKIDGDEQHPAMARFDGEIKSFADTAGLIANLDLVITADTSVLHCAAGMGIKTWMLDRFDSCWRWHRQFPNSSPWYDALTIYRQPSMGNWQSVIDRVVPELQHLEGKRHAKAA